MEYLAFGIMIILFIAVVFAKGMYDDRKRRKKFIYNLRHNYGQKPEKEYKPEQFATIASFYKRHPREGQLDDITWNDLGMDEVFKRLNIAHSSAGEEYLYYTLRSPQTSQEELQHLDEVAQFFQENEEERVNLQLILADLGRTGKSSLYDYLDYLDILGKRSNLKHIIMDALFVPAILLIPVQPSYGLMSFVLLSVWNFISYFKEKNEIDPYITSFSYIMRLMRAADKLEKKNWQVCQDEMQLLREHRKALGQFKRGSFWLMSTGRMSGSGNPLDILLDYLRMMLHLDLIKFNQMLAQVRHHLNDVDMMVQGAGFLETAVVVGAYRSGVSGGWCRPVFTQEERLSMLQVYHPLIDNPVKNSIETGKGVLLTGSNASGKSTFLKTVAVNAILAQTLYTCLADSYQSCVFRVCSSMALRDDLQGGESYYIVEIKAMKRVLDMAKASGSKVLCFVDEVLRGTNTVERIAASTQILHYLSGEGVTCFAATHDIELTDLLDEEYNNYHFEEDVQDGDVKFNYKLLKGKAVTRNAIKLLSVMGYEDAIIQKANAQAEHFIKTGVWAK